VTASSPNVLLLLALPEAVRERYREHLARAFPQLRIDLVDHHSRVGPYIEDAEVLITFGAHMADAVLERGRRLRWIQALGTGVDGILDRPALRDDVIVTNMHGHHGPAVSEAVLAAMLALARDLRRALAQQAQARWERFPVSLLAGSTVGIVGVGAIAEALAPRCAALSMRVVGFSASRRSAPHFERIHPRDQLAERAGELDFLVLLAPHTPQTHRLVDARVLAAMRPTAHLINVARGGLVDERALVQALEQGTIAGAALDVFETEPLAADSPLWRLGNVLITPHIAGFHTRYADEALPVLEENLRLYLEGRVDELRHLVRPAAGGDR